MTVSIPEIRRRMAKLFGIREEDVGQIKVTETIRDTVAVSPVVAPADQAHQATIPTATGDIAGKSRRADKIACKGVSKKEVG